MKLKIIIFAIAIFVLLLLLLLTARRSGVNVPETNIPRATTPGQESFPARLPTDQTYPNTDQEYIDSAKRIAEQGTPFNQKMQQVAKLILTLPYEGKYFSLKYDISVNSFDLTINKQFTQDGLEEFELYLKNKNVDKNLLNLETIYK